MTSFVIKNDSFLCFLKGTLIIKAILKELFYNTFNGSLQSKVFAKFEGLNINK